MPLGAFQEVVRAQPHNPLPGYNSLMELSDGNVDKNWIYGCHTLQGLGKSLPSSMADFVPYDR